MMVKSFKHRGLKRFFEQDDTRRLPHEMIARIRRILTQLEETEIIEDMNIYSWHLHELKGDSERNLERYSTGELAHHLRI